LGGTDSIWPARGVGPDRGRRAESPQPRSRTRHADHVK